MIEWKETKDGQRGRFKEAGGEYSRIFKGPLTGHLFCGPDGYEIELTREQAGELSKVLARFSETGELGPLTNVEG